MTRGINRPHAAAAEELFERIRAEFFKVHGGMSKLLFEHEVTEAAERTEGSQGSKVRIGSASSLLPLLASIHSSPLSPLSSVHCTLWRRDADDPVAGCNRPLSVPPSLRLHFALSPALPLLSS